MITLVVDSGNLKVFNYMSVRYFTMVTILNIYIFYSMNHILLYYSKITYMPLEKKWNNNSLSQLFSLLFGDFRPWDNSFLYQRVNCYNAHFIYHDFQTNMLYIGFGDWLIDENTDGPSDEEFPDYVNETNSCKMSVQNFLEFREQWVLLKQELPPFALIYRNDKDWIDCKGFESKEAMELFVKNKNFKKYEFKGA